MNSDDLAWLQNWYLQRCNGEWEHGQGIKLSTLDNPCWRLTINLGRDDRDFSALGGGLSKNHECIG
jgi:hypothetical protein